MTLRADKLECLLQASLLRYFICNQGLSLLKWGSFQLFPFGIGSRDRIHKTFFFVAYE